MQSVFQFPRYTLRRAATGLAKTVTIFASDSAPVLFCRPTAAGLRRELRVWQDETRLELLLAIRPRRSASGRVYAVYAPDESHPIGSMTHRDPTAALRETWNIMDASGNIVAELTGEAAGLAAEVQTYRLEVAGRPAGRLSVRRGRLQPVAELELTPNGAAIDPRLALAAALVLLSETPGVG